MIHIKAPAKINLALDVLFRRPDGYHEVDMVMQPLTLADDIILEPASGIEIICDHPQVPLDEKNLVWKAAQLLKTECQVASGVKIKIQKNIPVAAGLAGGSSDAAAVLTGLNQMWKLGLSKLKLMEYGVRIGADVPFCIMQRPARAEGIGEKLTPIAARLDCKVLLITPNIAVPTPLVYGKLKVDQITKRPNLAKVIDAMVKGDLSQLIGEWGNVLEEVVLPLYPEVNRVKGIIRQYHAENCLMSGSGPSVFALDPPEESVDLIKNALPSDWFCCVCRFLKTEN